VSPVSAICNVFPRHVTWRVERNYWTCSISFDMSNETATCFRSVDGLSHFGDRSNVHEYLLVRCVRWLIDTRHSRQNTSDDKIYDTPSGHCCWCPSTVLRIAPKFVRNLIDLSVNACTQHDHASTSSPTASDNAVATAIAARHHANISSSSAPQQ